MRIWTDPHILGHFTLCYLDLCIMRYLQYLMGESGVEVMSAERIMKAIDKPVATIIDEHDKAGSQGRHQKANRIDFFSQIIPYLPDLGNMKRIQSSG